MTYKNKKYGTKAAPKQSKRKWWVAALAVVLVLALGFGAYWQFFRDHTPKTVTTASSNTKGEPVDPSSSKAVTGTAVNGNSTGDKPASSPAAPPTTPNNKDQGTSATSNEPLVVPTGNFVSSHEIPADQVEESVCTTTPGALCTITFTSGGTTITLRPAQQTTDKGGSAYWRWTPRGMGLAAGSWTVTVTATLNGQTKSASDATPLKVV